MFIWDEWPQFFRGAPHRPDYWERRAFAVRHRLIEAASTLIVERCPDGDDHARARGMSARMMGAHISD